jgi:cell division protein FtsW (lipid II flippase)
MPPFEKIKEYTNTVCNQIRWEKARPAISEEIKNHIIDQKDAYIKEGMNEAEATNKAIVQMGDPIAVGTQLDRIHRPKPQWGMLILTISMLILGIIIKKILSVDNSLMASSFNAAQGVSVLAGITLLMIAYFADFTLIGKYPKAVYFSVLIFSIVTLIVSTRINGKAYYAAYCSLLFPVAFSAVVYSMRGKGYAGIILCELAFLFPAVIAILIPTFTGLLLFAISSMIILNIAIAKDWFIAKKLYSFILAYIPALGAIILFLLKLFSSPYVWNRINAAFHPELDPAGFGYRAVITKSLLENSKFLGCGTLPQQYASSAVLPLPEANTDFLLTYVTFKMGWLVFWVIMAMFTIFIVKGFIMCLKQKSALGLFVSISALLPFTFQVISYVFYNLGFELSGPLSLPLFSRGNIVLMINLVLIGLMLSVFRSGDIVKDKYTSLSFNNNFILWKDKKLIIDFGKKFK